MRWTPAAILLFVAAPARADDAPADAADERDGPVGEGNGALLFALGGLFNGTPASLDGVGVGGRYFTSDRVAVRAAVGFSHATTSVSVGSGGSHDTTASQYAAEGGAEWILRRSRAVMVYSGGLAQFSTGSQDVEGGTRDNSSVTVAGLLGGTWFFAERVSVGAEYRLGVQRQSTSTGNDKLTVTTWGVGSVGFLLGFWF